MRGFVVLSAVVVILSNQVASLRFDRASSDRNNFLKITSSLCGDPDLADSMSPEELQQDADYGTAISDFNLIEPNISSLGSLEHLKAADIQNVLNEDFRDRACSAFQPIESDLMGYIHNREKCLRLVLLNLEIFVAFYRTLCADDFIETMTDVLDTIGDNCLDSLFQLGNGKIKPNRENVQSCNEISGREPFEKYHDKPFAEFKNEYLQPLLKTCLLSHVGSTCGGTAGAQAQRLFDRFLAAFDF